MIKEQFEDILNLIEYLNEDPYGDDPYSFKFSFVDNYYWYLYYGLDLVCEEDCRIEDSKNKSEESICECIVRMVNEKKLKTIKLKYK